VKDEEALDYIVREQSKEKNVDRKSWNNSSLNI
jgi:hypothetical protein